MAVSLFITGASGFVGRRLLAALPLERLSRVVCLNRSPLPAAVAARPNVVHLPHGIHDHEAYAPHLAGADVVIHLAAVSGKAAPSAYFEVNAGGTERLVTACERAGVQRFLHVSTIAVKFAAAPRYHYARSKRQGEEAVRRGTLRHTIVRPTIVIGREGAVWQRLRAMATAPVIVLIGDGTGRIQPIFVDDLAACLAGIVERDAFRNETVDLGGPEVITMEMFLRRIHRRRHHREPRVVHVPYRPLVGVLSLLERALGTALPVTVGQLASFANDGTAEPNAVFLECRPRMRTVDDMLELVMADGG